MNKILEMGKLICVIYIETNTPVVLVKTPSSEKTEEGDANRKKRGNIENACYKSAFSAFVTVSYILYL